MERPIILVVEDHPTQQKVIELLAEEYGFHAVVVSDCQAAEQALKENLVYSLILMDLKLPDTDGVTCTSRLRPLIGENANVPVIGMSGMDNARDYCLHNGMDDFLAKPFTAREFRDMVHKWVHRSGKLYKFPENVRDKYSG
jgi:CheY-like chemotaxis protein